MADFAVFAVPWQSNILNTGTHTRPENVPKCVVLLWVGRARRPNGLALTCEHRAADSPLRPWHAWFDHSRGGCASLRLAYLTYVCAYLTSAAPCYCRGTVTLKSNDPFEYPHLEFNFLSVRRRACNTRCAIRHLVTRPIPNAPAQARRRRARAWLANGTQDHRVSRAHPGPAGFVDQR